MTTPGLGLDPSKRIPANHANGAPPAKKGTPPDQPDQLVPAAGTCDNCCFKPLIDALSSLINTICDGIRSVIAPIKNWFCPEPEAPPRPAVIPPQPKPDEKKADEKKAERVENLNELSLERPCTTIYADSLPTYNHVKSRLEALPADFRAKITFRDGDRMIDFHLDKSTLFMILVDAEARPIFRQIFGPKEQRIGGITVPDFDFTTTTPEAEKLIDRAVRFYSDIHTSTRCPVNMDPIHVGPRFSAQELLQTLAEKGHGISILESHHYSTSKFIPWFHMETLKKAGVDTFFIEGFPYELQDLLDDYFKAAPGSKPSPLLEAILDGLARFQARHRITVELEKPPAPAKKPKFAGIHRDPTPVIVDALQQLQKATANVYTIKDLVIKAQKLGIRVVGIDSDASVLTETRQGINDWAMQRLLAMNYQALLIIKKEKSDNGKYLLHTGALHAVDAEGVTGLAHSLGLPTVLAKDCGPQEVPGVYKRRQGPEYYNSDFVIIFNEPKKI